MPFTIQDAIHRDAPLSNLMSAAFADEQEFIAGQVFPTVTVAHESDEYYVLDKASWNVIHNDVRARKQSAQEITFQVSSDRYAVKNYALREGNAFEDLDNADLAIRLRETSAANITQALLRGRELRVAQKITSISNIGSGVVLAGATKWSNYVSSNPLADVATGHAFIRQQTGLMANTGIIDVDTLNIMKRHPALLDLYKYTQGGRLTNAQIQELLEVDRLLIGKGIYNPSPLNGTGVGSTTNIWGNNVVLAHITPGTGLKTRTLGLNMVWNPAGFPGAFNVIRYNDADQSKRVEWTEAGYFEDQKIVAPQLAYAITATL